MPRHVTRRRLLSLAGTALTASVAGCSADSAPDGTTTDATEPDGENATATTTTTATATDASEPSVYTRVYRETIDSVVLVKTRNSQGSGFVYDDGHVVTNAHVVGDADSVSVRFRGGEWRTGAVVGTDAYSDLAAVAIDDRPEAAAPLALREDTPTVGREVVVIGNPFGLDGTLTSGIVSGVNRAVPSPTGYSIPDGVQTDAAVNPGNSGGPIVSLDGRVVAVINSGGGDNVAFGISAALTRRVVADLIETGSYEHAFMGVSLATVTPRRAAANDLAEPRGILVVDVLSGGPSDGVLRPSDDTAVADGQRVPVGGDVIVALDGTAITSTEDLGSYLALNTRPGDTVSVTVLRDGDEQTLGLELGARPEPTR